MSRSTIFLSSSDTAAIHQMYERMVVGKESFWKVAYEPFMNRDLNRAQVTAVIRKGLEATHGRYKHVTTLFNMEVAEYKKFLNFLRKHRLHVPFMPYRGAKPRAAVA